MTRLTYDMLSRKSAIDFFPIQSINFKLNIYLWYYQCQETKVNLRFDEHLKGISRGPIG